jgi:hypothetical protein
LAAPLAALRFEKKAPDASTMEGMGVWNVIGLFFLCLGGSVGTFVQPKIKPPVLVFPKPAFFLKRNGRGGEI